MGSKTPIMILQELMVKKKCVAEFNLTRTSGGTHNPVFEFIVRAGPVTAKGEGRSKKDAKHDAAKNALKKLADIGYTESDTDYNHPSPHHECPDSPEIMLANYVGHLKEFCVEKRLPDPTFEIVSDIGPPHARKFTMSCSVGSIKCTGMSNTKKSAKQLASKKMLRLLVDAIDHGGIVVPYEEMANTKYDREALQKRDEIMKNMNTINLSRKLADYPQSLKELDSDLRLQAVEILNDCSLDPVEKLQNALKVLEINYEKESMSSCKLNKVGISVKLQSDPVFEILAFGDTASDAEIKVIENTLNFLKIMLN